MYYHLEHSCLFFFCDVVIGPRKIFLTFENTKYSDGTCSPTSSAFLTPWC